MKNMVNTDSKKIKEITDSRYIERVFPSKEKLKRVLKKRKQLKCYIGVDPTASQLHLGHSTNFLLLKKFQELGHRVIFLIGDFTAQIGDPTGKSVARKSLTKKEILRNCKDYKAQTGKILDFNSKKNPIKVKFNSQWFEKLSLNEIIKLMAKITHGRLIKREIFRNRIKEKKEIYFHELLYPLLQGYDSVVLKTDIEVGGNDQTFNMLIGRDLVKEYQKREKFVITTKLLINPKTKRKLMSKSEGNFIALNDSPNEMYGKIMALPDEVIIPCFELATEIPQKKLEKIKKELKGKKTNPRDFKIGLAKEIVKLYYGEKKAKDAQEEFNRMFQEKKLPSKIPVFRTSKKVYPILDLLFDSKLVSSKSEAKRVIEGGGVSIKIKNPAYAKASAGRQKSRLRQGFGGQAKIKNWKEKIKIKEGMVVQVGKRRFIKVKTK